MKVPEMPMMCRLKTMDFFEAAKDWDNFIPEDAEVIMADAVDMAEQQKALDEQAAQAQRESVAQMDAAQQQQLLQQQAQQLQQQALQQQQQAVALQQQAAQLAQQQQAMQQGQQQQMQNMPMPQDAPEQLEASGAKGPFGLEQR